MSPHFPSMTALRVLEAFDRLGSTTAAGAALGLTQSAVSRQLKTLETQLDAALFLREGRTLVLTPAGQDYADEIREVLGRIAQAGLRLHAPARTGQLTLAILPTFGMRWLVPRLPDFARTHPEVTINLVTRLKPFNFASEEIDAAIHFGEAEWPGTDSLRLRRETVIPVASPALAPGPLASPGEIAALPLLHIETRAEAWATWFAAHGVEPPRITGTVHDQFSTIMQAALHGLGAALLPTYLAEPEIAAGRLVRLCETPTEMPGAYYLVWPKAKAHDPALAVFRDWLGGQGDDEDLLPR
ncbi:LysR family transcriptional regulator [Roseovarius sp. SCSIO 43702]|uniref:LysR substrate-binding domain-containing protein n=1 Tax=Roseovarius sp. SCSIO 43702 TaxID=2823043 RepID=UPI001C737593|nr:LysR substrate-binding domain-containing protein [Roseovarius sp. SCSIO 43702]QYX55374.1 LysR family transcriptional regulator [Roseovarius sp. SCSIO 43702]